jgi:hypothetical protein
MRRLLGLGDLIDERRLDRLGGGAVGPQPLGLGGELLELRSQLVAAGRGAAQVALAALDGVADRAQLAAHLGGGAGGLGAPVVVGERSVTRSRSARKASSSAASASASGSTWVSASTTSASSARNRAPSASRLATTPASSSCPWSRSRERLGVEPASEDRAARIELGDHGRRRGGGRPRPGARAGAAGGGPRAAGPAGGQVGLGGGEAALGLLLALAVLEDAGGLLDDEAALLGAGVEHGVDLALADDDVLLAADAGVGEQLLDVEQAARHAVDGVLAVAGAEQVRVIVTSVNSIGSRPEELSMVSAHLGPTERGPLGGAGEDDVVHLLGAHRRAPGRRAPRRWRRRRWTCPTRWGRPRR